MLELTGIASILKGVSFIYWLLALAGVVLVAWKVKGKTYRALGIAAVVGLFGYLPAQSWLETREREAYAREAWAYFKKKCDTESGEKIYKTYSGVKSVLMVKPLPPATEKDLYDQFWYGDPYSDASTHKRAEALALKLSSKTAPIARGVNGVGYEFVEMPAVSRQGIARFFYLQGSRNHETSHHERAESRFGISWDDISTPEDRKYWIAGSRLRVVDLSDNSVVAERFGYLIESGFGSTAGQRRPWQSARGIGPNGRTCPEAHDWSDRWFLLKVLNPNEGASHGK